MEDDLTKVLNIGKETARKLNEIGIDSYETLVHLCRYLDLLILTS